MSEADAGGGGWMSALHRVLDALAHGAGVRGTTPNPEEIELSPAERRYEEESAGANKPPPMVQWTWRW